MGLTDTYTSTGAKFFHHQEAMRKLRNGHGQPIVTHIMLTDICNHSCAFCSVQARAGDSLPYDWVFGYLDELVGRGLRAVILSGGGNPILYRCRRSGADFDDVVAGIKERGLEIGLITNGAPLGPYDESGRRSWKTVHHSTLDKLTWVRISMSGLDHDERSVYIPDIDPCKTALGFSYVAHDIYTEPADPHHGKVSRPLDLLSGNRNRAPDMSLDDRLPWLTDEITRYVLRHNPSYVRLLPNCLEPERIKFRCEQLQHAAHEINEVAGREVAFVQNKPPSAPKACYLGYVHPVLAPSGYVMPCDSHCLNESANHQLGGEPWRICHWSEVGKLYDEPVRTLINDPSKTCPGCVFGKTNELLLGVVDGTADITPPSVPPDHVNFV